MNINITDLKELVKKKAHLVINSNALNTVDFKLLAETSYTHGVSLTIKVVEKDNKKQSDWKQILESGHGLVVLDLSNLVNTKSK